MAAPRPKVLVLDGQGVVFSAPIRSFLRLFAKQNALSYESIEERWDREVRVLAWNGSLSDREIWEQLAGKKIDFEATMQALHANYAPGPATSHLCAWSRKVPIWLLSNHRAHWLEPQLRNLGLEDVFDELLISDRTGQVKPGADAFRPLLDSDLRPEDFLFVDDQPLNLATASDLGIPVLLATPEPSWVTQIDELLQG